MSYSNIIFQIKNIASKLNTSVTSLHSKSNSINSSWSGDAPTKLSSDFANTISDLENEISNLNELASVLEKIDQYDKLYDDLQSAERSRSNLNPNSFDYSSAYSNYSSKINSIKSKLSSLKSTINSSMPSVETTGTNIEQITYQIDESYKDKLASIGELYNIMYHNRSLNVSTLNKVYSNEDFHNYIDDYVSGSTGREKSVLTGLALIRMGIDKGIVSQYKSSISVFNSISKPYSVNEVASYGADCCSFVSALLNEGVNGAFNNASRKTLQSLGTKQNVSEGKPGDILVSSNHAMMIVENHYQDGYVIVMDCGNKAYDTTSGIRLQKVPNKTLESYECRNLDSVYSN